MEQVFYLPTKRGFVRVCYVPYEVFVEKFADKDYNQFSWFFVDFDWVLVEDERGELHLASVPTDVIDIWDEVKRRKWKEEERLKREREEERKKEREEEELPF